MSEDLSLDTENDVVVNSKLVKKSNNRLRIRFKKNKKIKSCLILSISEWSEHEIQLGSLGVDA